MSKKDYELIFCIVNQGFSEAVMEAAKNAGATGGTVMKARGTAAKEAETFFKITIQPEKEVVMVLIPKALRDGVLHAVYKEAGLGTSGQGIAFSLPVEEAIGLAPAQEEKKNAQ